MISSHGFGQALSRNAARAVLLDVTATFARGHTRATGIGSWSWSLLDESWLELPVETRLAYGAPIEYTDEVYDYATMERDSAVVDFAAHHVGGGCFGSSFRSQFDPQII